MRVFLSALVSITFVLAFGRIDAQEVDSFLAGGEFGLATNVADQSTIGVRDNILAQISTAQSTSGQPIAGSQTANNISSSTAWANAADGAAAGGGAFADFQSLIDLIQTTVVPDTWEALGGPSTIAEYAGGVYVDAAGTVLECVSFDDKDEGAELKALLNRSGDNQIIEGADDWRKTSKLRFVSLRRLRDHISMQRFVNPNWHAGNNTASANLAGLSAIKYVFLTEDDVVIAGPVGGITKRDGWFIDRKTGLSAIRTDFLMSCLSAAIGNQPFGCTIDPTPQGLRNAAQVTAAVSADQIPIGKAAERMREALGMQRVEVFGTAADTTIGYLMVEADRHMKQLALAKMKMPEGVASYLDVIDASIAKGTPSELLLRLWFTAQPQPVRTNDDKTVFEIGGTPLKLSGENQRALADGSRGRVLPDFRSVAYVEQFNDHWSAIRGKYPVYAALESIYRSATVARLAYFHGSEAVHLPLLQSFAAAASADVNMPAPRQVMSIATHHTVRHGTKRHHIIVASGGVSVNTSKSVSRQLISYPALNSESVDNQPALVQRWWWD